MLPDPSNREEARKLRELRNQYEALQKKCWHINIEQSLKIEETKADLITQGAPELAGTVDELSEKLGTHRGSMGQVVALTIVSNWERDVIQTVTSGSHTKAIEPAVESEKTKGPLDTIYAFVERAKQWIKDTFGSSSSAQYKEDLQKVRKEAKNGGNGPGEFDEPNPQSKMTP